MESIILLNRCFSFFWTIDHVYGFSKEAYESDMTFIRLVLGLPTKSFSSMCHVLFRLMTYHLLRESKTHGIMTLWDHVYNLFTFFFSLINVYFNKTFITLPIKFYICLWTFILPNAWKMLLCIDYIYIYIYSSIDSHLVLYQ